MQYYQFPRGLRSSAAISSRQVSRLHGGAPWRLFVGVTSVWLEALARRFYRAGAHMWPVLRVVANTFFPLPQRSGALGSPEATATTFSSRRSLCLSGDDATPIELVTESCCELLLARRSALEPQSQGGTMFPHVDEPTVAASFVQGPTGQE